MMDLSMYVPDKDWKTLLKFIYYVIVLMKFIYYYVISIMYY